MTGSEPAVGSVAGDQCPGQAAAAGAVLHPQVASIARAESFGMAVGEEDVDLLVMMAWPG